MPSTNKIALSIDEVRDLLVPAKQNGTMDMWALLALEWMEAAEGEIVALRAALEAPRDIVLK